MGKEMHPFSLLLARLEVPLLAPRRNAGLRGVPVCSQVVMMGRQEICTVHLREGEVSPKSDIETHEGTRSLMLRGSTFPSRWKPNLRNAVLKTAAQDFNGSATDAHYTCTERHPVITCGMGHAMIWGWGSSKESQWSLSSHPPFLGFCLFTQ